MNDFKRYIIFTDLDGTLLDHQTYSFEGALPALSIIKDLNIPLILTSSKTSTEIQALRTQLQNKDPFIPENGGAIYIPENYFQIEFPFQKKKDDYLIIELGTSYSKLRQALKKIKLETGLPIVGFGDLMPKQLVKKTGLSSKEARLALNREYDEPFFIYNGISESNFQHLKKIISSLGLNLTMGGRFFHLMGNNDKGKAVKILISIFKNEWKEKIRTLGIGDSLNDLPMLAVVNEPILVQKPSREYDKAVLAELKPILADGVGPIGWNDVVLNLLSA